MKISAILKNKFIMISVAASPAPYKTFNLTPNIRNKRALKRYAKGT